MFQPTTIRVCSIIAIVCAIIGFLLSLLTLKMIGMPSVVGIISWGLLLWASIIGYQLSKMKLYEDEYKKVGLRIYAILICFLLFMFVGIVVGLIIAVLLLSTLWALKSNYDDWEPSVELQADSDNNKVEESAN